MPVPFPTITLPGGEEDTLHERLSSALLMEIRRGRLVPGLRLPGTRSLAVQLGISRTTVLRAYEELVAQGWLVTRTASGTFVAETARALLVEEENEKSLAAHCLPRLATSERHPELAASDPGVSDMSHGKPDPRLFPVDLLARAHRRALRQRGKTLLDYGDPRGDPGLRRSTASLFRAKRGLAITADNVLVTRGSQMAISLASAIFIRPGDRVAIESHGYPPAWRALEHAGAELLPIDVDHHGLCVEELADIDPPRAVYVTPHHQFPTMAVMPPSRRATLLSWASQTGALIIEDDYDHEFQYHGRPVLPLMSSSDLGGIVYVSSLSKVMAPGIRIGFLIASRRIIDAAASVRVAFDRQGDLTTEAAVSSMMDSGELQRHIRKMRRVYERRRDHLLHLLRTRFETVLEPHSSPGGMAIWARIVDGTDPEEWRDAALRLGVRVGIGRDYDFLGKASPHLRMGFAAHDRGETEEAMDALHRAHALCVQ